MIDGKAADFIEKLSYEDHYVIFQGNKYFINGCCAKSVNDEKEIHMSVYIINENGSINTIIFEIIKPTISECLTAFENAPIWNGKSFWEAENEIQWVDC